MKIKPAGIEYAHIPVSGVPYDAGLLEVSFDNGVVWYETEWNDAKTVATILVGGPDSTPATQVVLPLGRHQVQVRLVDTPEVVIRDTGSVVEVRSS